MLRNQPTDDFQGAGADTPMTDAELPVTWPELVRAEREAVLQGLQLIQDVPARLDAVRPPCLVSELFGGPSLTLAEAAAVVGPVTCFGAIETLTSLLPRVMADFASGIDTANRVPAANMLSLFNTARCCGAALPP